MPRHGVRRVNGVILKEFRKIKYFDIEKEALEEMFPHPNVTELVDAHMSPFSGVLVFPDYGHCDLYNCLDSFDDGLPLDITCTILKKIVIALHFASLFGIVHRDIKLENVMIDESGSVKLIDWELSTKNAYSRQKVGTLGYLAPEVFFGKSCLCKPMDMWCLGVTIFSLYFGKRPYGDVPEKARYTSHTDWYDSWLKLIQRGQWKSFWKQFEKHTTEKIATREFKECIEGLLCYNPEKRMTLEELMECDLLNKQLASRETLKEIVFSCSTFH